MLVKPHSRAARKARRKAKAVARTEFWQRLSPQQQLAALDRRLGEGVGAVKQRARLAALIQKAA
jgi:hypothetical protein